MAFISPLAGRLASARGPRVCGRRRATVRAEADGEMGTRASLPEPLEVSPSPGVELGEAGEPAAPEVEDVDVADVIRCESLAEYAEQKAAGLMAPVIQDPSGEWSDAWALAVQPKKAQELKNQYSRVGILLDRNFADFGPIPGCEAEFAAASLTELSSAKARAVYEATGMPAIAETHEMSIDAPESGSRINKTLQQGYHTRNVEEEGDAMIDRVRPISDENRMTRFRSAVAYYDGEMEILESGEADVAIVFSATRYMTIAVSSALDEVYKALTRRLGLKLSDPSVKVWRNRDPGEDDGPVLVGASMLRERILREGKMLNDNIIKVSSFVNHMVDTELMEVCGEELAERLRHTMPNKILTVESTGLIAGLPTARKLGIPLVFARKSRPITISDSYQTSYRSATKGTTNELIVSCEYLESGDRVLIIDDFLAGGSTAEALFKLAKMAHAKVVGVGVLIEKMSDGGRAFLSGYDIPIESLAKILPGGDRGEINFVDEEPWKSPAATKDAEANRAMEARRALSEQKRYLARARQGEDDDDDGEGGVDVISWEDEDSLDALEDTLIKEVGKKN